MTINREGNLICDICGNIIIENTNISNKTLSKEIGKLTSICKTCTRVQQAMMPETD